MQELLIIILSSLPASGQQVAILVAAILDMSIYKAFILALIGSMIHPLPIVLLMHKYGTILENQNNIIGRILRWRLASLHKFRYMSTFSIFIIVAIPFPYFGSYAASVLVWTLGLPIKQNIIAIMLGLIVSCILITLGVYGVFEIFDI